MGDCIRFARGKKDEVKAYGAFSFLNDKETGVWFRRDDNDPKAKRGGRTAARRTPMRGTTRTAAMADAGAWERVPSHNALQRTSLPLLNAQPLMPRSRLGVPVNGGMGGVRPRGPLAQSLSAVEPEPDCNGMEDFIVLAMVFVLAFVGLKKFRRVQKAPEIQEPLMDA